MGNVTKLPLDGFRWVETTSQFNKDFLENYNNDSDEGYFVVKLKFNIPKHYMTFTMTNHFHLKGWKLNN